VTERIQLFTTVLNVGWRNNTVLFAKQLATVDLLSGAGSRRASISAASPQLSDSVSGVGRGLR
jgi:hypothetical protein